MGEIKMAETGGQALIRFHGISKTFGRVRALTDIDFSFLQGECVGIAGHNGAGKSTLMAVLAGVFEPTQGKIEVDGAPSPRYDANVARHAGVRCVFQELSLCANLSIAENMCIVHPQLRGRGWRRQATALMREKLEEIFPGNGLVGTELVSDLTLTQRQMVEIARAFTVTDAPVRLVILDEPTSSLDAHTAEQLLAFVRKAAERGITCLLITHMLGEIQRVADRVMVMRDGSIVSVLGRENLSRETIITAMGQHLEADKTPDALRARVERAAGPQYQWTLGSGRRTKIDASHGEVIGFAGLAGQGQTEALLAIYEAATSRGAGHAKVAFVAGDRGRDGIFPVWSIAQNLDLRWLSGGTATGTRRRPGFGLVDFAAARAVVEAWRVKIGIRGASMNAGILSLSGGNQQKVLFARALASDADLILMDDPTRGVDVGTKRDIYQLVRDEAAKGRTFIWYTTENEELSHCDRTYVFRSASVTRVLHADECTEEALLAASFEEQAA
ncbi:MULTISPECIES: sugar ABC transporter ATP-binding protein [Burkholderiaceae]|uniref:Ribose ABC transport system, ATP-binding protein RbsA n=1 Tax=Caballeronia sordidicola TaxID=196367 RepID=A0A242N597_CABSO|nr:MULTISPECIES: sugar ABC transporter ATP-binding protein [Burkholderiaceae]AMH43926.1 ABC transporter ATP-binding protein [Burkholderia sp. PAMC 26561]OTP78336.1 Ribose ABC transport system, ATP-binding protein RbsA [Caballeronia sordidicola]